MKLNVKNLETWLAALRSKRYPQAKGLLHYIPGKSDDSKLYGGYRGQAEGYCCLGVGCDEAGVEIDHTMSLPPWSFWEWLGFEEADIPRDEYDEKYDRNSLTLIVTDEEGKEHDVATRNDGSGWDFSMIADLIDENRDRLSLRA